MSIKVNILIAGSRVDLAVDVQYTVNVNPILENNLPFIDLLNLPRNCLVGSARFLLIQHEIYKDTPQILDRKVTGNP